jgi:photosystem II stability/assembly factor-like uncharacterized protein
MADDGRPRADEEGWLEADQPGRPFSAQIRERRRSVVGTLALALLVIGVIVAASARSVATTRPAPSPKPQGSSVWFQPLHYVTSVDFFTPNDGVVLTNLSSLSAGGLSPYVQSLLATHDGGRHWRDITPTAAGSVGCCVAFFLDPLHGWAVGNWAPGSSPALIVFRTIDGGATWTHTEIPRAPGGCCPSIDFVDSQHGWLVYGNEFQGSFGVQLPSFLRTVDGGATWTDLPDLPGPPLGQSLILVLSLSPFRFVSPSTGWFVESTPSFGGPLDENLYLTRDGGSSWQRQDVPLPPSNLARGAYLTVPTLTANGKGALPVSLGDGSGVLLDFSDDGGATWRTDGARGPLFSVAPDASGTWNHGAPVFVGHGMMAIVVGKQLQINSGTGWTMITPTGLPPSVQRIQFTDQRVGWALGHGSICQGDQCASDELLFKTIDGGHSWTRVGG